MRSGGLMRKTSPRLAPAALLAAALASGGLKAQNASASFAPGSGVEVLQTHCAVCHPPTMITGKRLTARQWGNVVDQMISKGAQVSDRDYDVIVAYLTKHYGAD